MPDFGRRVTEEYYLSHYRSCIWVRGAEIEMVLEFAVIICYVVYTIP